MKRKIEDRDLPWLTRRPVVGREPAVMALLSQQEFTQAIVCLSEDLGLQRLRDRFVRLNALVSRRKISSPEKLAGQLFLLTGGLRRQVPATVAFHSIWNEQVQARMGKDGEKELEEVAKEINSCLGERDCILEEKRADLEAALRRYWERLAAGIGPDRARLDMLLKSVPAVEELVRNMPQD